MIGFIGGGNMASAIISGLIANGTARGDIIVSDPSDEARERIETAHGVACTSDPADLADVGVVILAVKPQIVEPVAKQVCAAVDMGSKLLISIAAGVTLSRLETLFGSGAIIRTMPNTGALMGKGATAMFSNTATTPAQCERAKSIIEAFGICVEVESEQLLDSVTAVSGSGPAYFFYLVEEMIKAGVSLGLSEADAKALTVQTAAGAAALACESEFSPTELREMVTSPNGTTHAAITSMRGAGFSEVIQEALKACYDRSVELGADQ